MWDDVVAEIGPMPERPEADDEASLAAWEKEKDAYRRKISKTTQYTEFHAGRIEKGQGASSLIGNQYTGSIFLALMSTLESDLEDNSNLDNACLGCAATAPEPKRRSSRARSTPAGEKWSPLGTCSRTCRTHGHRPHHLREPSRARRTTA